MDYTKELISTAIKRQKMTLEILKQNQEQGTISYFIFEHMLEKTVNRIKSLLEAVNKLFTPEDVNKYLFKTEEFTKFEKDINATYEILQL